MITIQLTDQEAALLQESVRIAQNTLTDFPNERPKWCLLHNLYVKIDLVVRPLNHLGIQSTVEPPDRNNKQPGRI